MSVMSTVMAGQRHECMTGPTPSHTDEANARFKPPGHELRGPSGADN
jgi:hypothetical protein